MKLHNRRVRIRRGAGGSGSPLDRAGRIPRRSRARLGERLGQSLGPPPAARRVGWKRYRAPRGSVRSRCEPGGRDSVSLTTFRPFSRARHLHAHRMDWDMPGDRLDPVLVSSGPASSAAAGRSRRRIVELSRPPQRIAAIARLLLGRDENCGYDDFALQPRQQDSRTPDFVGIPSCGRLGLRVPARDCALEAFGSRPRYS
jgi:hypothetical protein